jgi:RHS repeat-associated protein
MLISRCNKRAACACGRWPEVWNGKIASAVNYNLSGEQVVYGYDGANHRVWHRNWLSDYFYFYGVDGHRIGGYSWDGTDTVLTIATGATPEIYFMGRLTGQDQVGNANGGGSYPYGEAYTTPAPSSDYHSVVGFATYTGDPTGLDYALNRHYNATWGRFLNPDPYLANNGGPGNPRRPQTWNRYAYVEGDPVNRNDQYGLFSSGAEDCIADPEACEDEDWGDGLLPGDGLADLASQGGGTLGAGFSLGSWLGRNGSGRAGEPVPEYFHPREFRYFSRSLTIATMCRKTEDQSREKSPISPMTTALFRCSTARRPSPSTLPAIFRARVPLNLGSMTAISKILSQWSSEAERSN